MLRAGDGGGMCDVCVLRAGGERCVKRCSGEVNACCMHDARIRASTAALLALAVIRGLIPSTLHISDSPDKQRKAPKSGPQL